MAQGWNPGLGYGPPPQTKSSNTGATIGLVAGVVVVIGIVGYFVLSGLEKSNRNARISEARNTVGAIFRRASIAYSYGQEWPDGELTSVLCGSATPVPATVPKGTKYQPSSKDGEDYQTGTATEGWKCLRFTFDTPTHFQFEYRVGGDYKAPTRGGPDPGPDAFEVSAEGDLDGDGKTSLFILMGQINKVTGALKQSEPWSVDEGE